MAQPSQPPDILLVDNDAEDLMFFGEAYARLSFPYPLKAFSDPLKALEYIDQSKVLPLMIVADVTMPGTSGLDFRQILKKSPRALLQFVPFFFLSGMLDNAVMERCTSMSIQGAFTKPDHHQQLADIIESMVRHSETLAAEAA